MVKSKNIKIFIVEDEIIIANDIQRILNENGYQVSGIATKFSQAQKMIAKLRPNIVLCDINLNGARSGIQLMKELSKSIRFSIIFISAYTDSETLKDAHALNPFSYLTKPFNDRQLITSIQLAIIAIEDTHLLNKPSSRELEIIRLVAQGFNNAQIGEKLFISMLTAKTHRRNLLTKYGLKNSVELISLAMQQGWI
jgi:DNA-binding NarL/FixJ family response regulator